MKKYRIIKKYGRSGFHFEIQRWFLLWPFWMQIDRDHFSIEDAEYYLSRIKYPIPDEVIKYY